MHGSIEFNAQIPSSEGKRLQRSRETLRNKLVLAVSAFLVAGIYLKSTAAPGVALEPRALTFSAQPVGASGELHQVRLTNSGGLPLHIQNAMLTGEQAANFKLPDAECEGKTLAPGEHCQVFVSVRPTANGLFSAQLIFIDDAVDSPQHVNLQGAGSGRGDLEVLPLQVEFKDGWVGERGDSQHITVKNIGTAQVQVRSIAWASGQPQNFRKDDTCDAAVLTPNNKCSFAVTFAPREVGRRSARLIVMDSTGDKAHEVDLEGTGVLRVPLGKWEPARLEFGREEEGSKGAVQQATLTNAGSAELHLSQGSVRGAHSGDFTILATDCSARVLNPGGSCSVQIRFTPHDQGTHEATLSFEANTAKLEVSLSMVGTVVPPRKPAMVFSPSQLNFGKQERGKKGDPLPMQIVSVGAIPLHVDRVQIVGTDQQSFDVVENNCNGVDLPGKTRCEVRIAFSPKAKLFFAKRGPKSESGMLVIYDNAADSPHNVPLVGESYSREPVQSSLSLNPEALDFSPETPGRQGTPQLIVVTNVGNAPVRLGEPKVVDTSIAGAFLGANRGNFQIVENECQSRMLAAQAQCRIRVAFQPGVSGALRANLLVSDTSGGQQRSASLSGQGLEQQGWCCLGGSTKRLYSLDAATCKKRNGTFYADASQAKRECVSVIGGMVLPGAATTTASTATIR